MPVSIKIKTPYNANLVLKHLTQPKKDDRKLAWFILGSKDAENIIDLFQDVKAYPEHRPSFSVRHYRRGVVSILKHGDAVDAADAFTYIPIGASYVHLRNALLARVLAQPVKDWLRTGVYRDWRTSSKFMREEAEAIAKKIVRTKNPALALDLLVWNAGQKHEMYETHGDILDALLAIIMNRSDFVAAKQVFDDPLRLLARNLMEVEILKLVAAMVRGALLNAEAGDCTDAHELTSSSAYFGLVNDQDKSALEAAIESGVSSMRGTGEQLRASTG